MLSPNDLQATIAMVGETPDGSLAAVGTAIAAQYTLDATGLMTTTAPVSPPYPAPYPDANSDLYRGSPYVSPPNPQGSQGTGW
jgi:hypothetical protein